MHARTYNSHALLFASLFLGSQPKYQSNAAEHSVGSARVEIQLSIAQQKERVQKVCETQIMRVDLKASGLDLNTSGDDISCFLSTFGVHS